MTEDNRKNPMEAEAQQQSIYSHAIEMMKEKHLASLQEAVSLFSMIPGYSDSDLQATRCIRMIAEIKSNKKERTKEIIKNSIIIVITTIIVVLFLTVLVPGIQYRSAKTLMSQGKYREAGNTLSALGDYSDSMFQLEVCEEHIREEEYQKALQLEEAGDLEAAKPVFEELGAYKDAAVRAAEILDAQYKNACSLKEDGKKTEALMNFSSMEGYLDSESRAEGLREEIYQDACGFRAEKKLEEAEQLFADLGDYKDSKEQRKEIRKELKEQGKAAAEETENKAESETEAAGQQETDMEAAQKRLQMILIILAVMILLLAAAGIPVYFRLVRPELTYRKALKLMKEARFEEAIPVFEDLEDYKDSRRKVRECRKALLDLGYEEALSQKEAGEYERAINSFTKLNGYRDSAEQIRLCKNAILDIAYDAALSLKDAGKFEEGAKAFEELKGYRDSTFQAALCRIAIEKEPVYEEACRLFEENNYKKAMEIFRALNNYRDSRDKIRKIRDVYYKDAVELKIEKLYPEAISAFVALEGYRDSLEQIAECREAMLAAKYREGLFLMEQQEYEAAIDVLKLVRNYSNSQELIEKCKKKIKAPRPFNHLSRGMTAEEVEAVFGKPLKTGKGREKNQTEAVYSNVRLMDAVGYLTVFFTNGRLERAVWHGDFAWEPYEKENGGLFPGTEYNKYKNYYTFLFGNCTSEYLKDNHKGSWWRSPQLTVDVSGYDYVTIHFTL